MKNEAGRVSVDNEPLLKFAKSEYVVALFASRQKSYVEQKILFKKVESIIINCNKNLEEMVTELGRFWETYLF